MTPDGNDDADEFRPGPDDSPLTLTVDDEVFVVTVDPDGSCSYDWRSGPHAYGFSSSPVRVAGDPERAADLLAHPYRRSVAQHRASIAEFLSNIDPETGYLD